MKINSLMQLTIGMLAVALSTSTIHAQNAPKMKMTTEIQEGIATPDKVETRLGTMTLRDGIPDKATVEKMYDLSTSKMASRRL